MRNKYLIFTIVLIIISGTTVIAWNKLNSKIKVGVKIDPLKVPELDPLIMDKFAKACQQFDPNQKEFLLIGQIMIEDGADSSLTMHSAPYIFSKKGDEFYYKLGQTEVINANGLYLFLENDQKKIIISEQKPIETNLAMPDANKLLKNLKGEMYTLINRDIDDKEVISLINEYHLSCKEFTISINKDNLQLQSILIRLSNPDYPEDDKKDKKLELKIQKISTKSNIGDYVEKQVVKKVHGNWALAPNYINYELITL